MNFDFLKPMKNDGSVGQLRGFEGSTADAAHHSPKGRDARAIPSETAAKWLNINRLRVPGSRESEQFLLVWNVFASRSAFLGHGRGSRETGRQAPDFEVRASDRGLDPAPWESKGPIAVFSGAITTAVFA